MKKIAWITDSTCILPDDICQKHHIYKVPLSVIMNGVPYKDGIDITPDVFFERLKTEQATTSQPAIADFLSLYEQLKGKYDEGVFYAISSRLSGTFSTGVQAAEMAGFPLHAVDSQNGVHPMSVLLLQAVTDYENGASLESVVSFLRERSEQIEIYFAAGSLEQLHRSGRVKNSQAFIGALLNIKPIFRFEEGLVNPVDKVRSTKRAHQYLLDKLWQDHASFGAEHISVFHAADEETAQRLQEQIETRLSGEQVAIHPLTPVVGALIGEGSIGLTWIKKANN